LILALLILVLLSLLGLFMSISATTSVQISDNYEAELQATYAALAGVNHARVLLRGVEFDALLKGPDGFFDPGAVYQAEAKSYRFRMPLPLAIARTLSIADPAADVATIPDDGIMSTGVYAATAGIALIPKEGISQPVPNPYGAGAITSARYFVKVTDNNGESSETSGDTADSPSRDGDGIVIVRSMGVSKTMSERLGAILQQNSVAVFETRLKRLSTWRLGSALVALGSQVIADFDGAFEIAGGAFPGIATVDTDPTDGIFPDQILRGAVAGVGSITGGGIADPSIRDVTRQVSQDGDQARLLQPGYLWEFAFNKAPRLADSFFSGNQDWLGASAPYLGSYNPAEPSNAPDQDPRITVVNGDLRVSNGVSGGGLLIVTGSFSCSGSFSYSGLILVIGSGNLMLTGTGAVIEGGLFTANLLNSGGSIVFGASRISINGNSRVNSNDGALRMAISLIPPTQLSFREIAGSDP
jgi:hypothetical protein